MDNQQGKTQSQKRTKNEDKIKEFVNQLIQAMIKLQNEVLELKNEVSDLKKETLENQIQNSAKFL